MRSVQSAGTWAWSDPDRTVSLASSSCHAHIWYSRINPSTRNPQKPPDKQAEADPLASTHLYPSNKQDQARPSASFFARAAAAYLADRLHPQQQQSKSRKQEAQEAAAAKKMGINAPFLETPDEDLICQICHGVLDKPVTNCQQGCASVFGCGGFCVGLVVGTRPQK